MKGKIIEPLLIGKYYACGLYLRLALIRLYLRYQSPLEPRVFRPYFCMMIDFFG
jgi:hypothetical protein